VKSELAPPAQGFVPPNPDFRAFLERFFAEQGYLRLIGTVLARIEPGFVEYQVPYRADIGQQHGFFHGGVVGGIAEAVMGAAAATLVAQGSTVVGAEYKVNLLSPALGATLIGRGQVVKPGRRLIVCRADILVAGTDGTERLCAIAQGAMAVVAADG
jgi:uncharacterized protein (TIGR00369 family)